MKMEFVQNFPFFSILIAMAGGIVCAVIKGKYARIVGFGVIAAIFAMSAAVFVYAVNAGESYTYMMGHFSAPWGNEIRIGILEALMATVFSAVLILSLLGGLRHIVEDVPEKKLNLYFGMMCLLMSSLLALIYTNDLFTAYVFVEINTIASCSIVMLKDSKETLVATTKYLIMSLLGSGLFLIGIALLYNLTGHLLMESLKESVAELVENGQYIMPLTVIVCLFAVGMATKSALYPFHAWLPEAHASSTSTSSAVLSGLVLKGYIILLMKIFYRVIGLEVIAANHVLNVLFLFGVAGMTMGSIHALKQKDIKRMIAFSSVAQIGYIYMGIGLGTELGFVAACFHILVHAITKPMLFCAAGGLMEVSGGSKKFKDLKGSGRRNKLAGAAFAVGAFSMIGLPLLSGFISKVYFAQAACELSTKMIVTLAALAVSSVLNAMYYIPALINIFRKNDEDKNQEELAVTEAHRFDPCFTAAMVVFIIANFMLGSMPSPVLELIEAGLKMFG